jgi:hypothetical protein
VHLRMNMKMPGAVISHLIPHPTVTGNKLSAWKFSH